MKHSSRLRMGPHRQSLCFLFLPFPAIQSGPTKGRSASARRTWAALRPKVSRRVAGVPLHGTDGATVIARELRYPDAPAATWPRRQVPSDMSACKGPNPSLVRDGTMISLSIETVWNVSVHPLRFHFRLRQSGMFRFVHCSTCHTAVSGTTLRFVQYVL